MPGHILLTKNSQTLRTFLIGLVSAAVLSLGSVVSAQADGGGIGSGGGDDGDRTEESGSASKYDRAWDGFASKDRKWARSTGECESGNNPNAYNSSGPYYGAFQFLKSTWRSSPMSPGGKPTNYNWKTQAVVAVKLKHRDSWKHWPVCGR